MLSRKRGSGVIQIWATGRGILQRQFELLPDEAGMIGEITVNLLYNKVEYIRRNVSEILVNEEA